MKSKNRYEYPVYRNAGKLKHAVDFIAPERTPVKAAADGKTVNIKSDSDIGRPERYFDKFINFLEMNNSTINGGYPFHIRHCIHLYDKS